jgi:hypothetical protein
LNVSTLVVEFLRDRELGRGMTLKGKVGGIGQEFRERGGSSLVGFPIALLCRLLYVPAAGFTGTLAHRDDLCN